MRKYDIINLLGKKFNYNSYLEISSISTGYTYDRIDSNIFTRKSGIHYIQDTDEIDTNKVPRRKDINIEPNKYEYHHNKVRNEDIKYDIVFIDSWHTYQQSLKDIYTALELVSNNGIIIVHDCCPYTEDLIGPCNGGEWCGQTYEAFINFRYDHKELETFCVYTDYGCGIISLNWDFSVPISYTKYDKDELKNWKYFNENKKELLNLIEPDEFMEYYNKL